MCKNQKAQINIPVKFQSFGKFYVPENESFSKEFRIKNNDPKILKELNKKIKEIYISKLEDDLGVFGIGITSKFQFQDNSKLEIKTTIPSRNFKRNPEWLFTNISIIGDVKTNLYKANNFAKIVIDKKMDYSSIINLNILKLDA